MKIAVIGLGKLGTPMAALYAFAGHDVVGCDANAATVEMLNAHKSPIEEPEVQELLDGMKGTLRATMDAKEAVVDAEIVFIVVPTPSLTDGSFSIQYVHRAISTMELGGHYKFLVLVSTVMPGDTQRLLGGGLYCYSPEFIALGSVVRNMRHPDFLLIGESSKEAGDKLERFYADTFHRLGLCCPPVARMNCVNAELAKLTVNTFVTSKISFANSVGMVCEKIPSADAKTVLEAVGLDSRIGRRYFTSAVSYGGPCFPRDNRAFMAVAGRVCTSVPIARATDQVNHEVIERYGELILSYKPSIIGILGLTYKTDTPVTEESTGRRLVDWLTVQTGGYLPIVAYDPLGIEGKWPMTVKMVASAEEVCHAADVIIIPTAWPEFKVMPLEPLARESKRTIIDCWRILENAPDLACVNYVVPGKGPAA